MLLLQDCTGEMQAAHKFFTAKRALKEEIQLHHNATVNQPRRAQSY